MYLRTLCERELHLSLFSNSAGEFPFANSLQRFLPIAQLEGFAYFRAGQESIYPDRALTVAMLAALRPVFTASPMPAVESQHSGSL